MPPDAARQCCAGQPHRPARPRVFHPKVIAKECLVVGMLMKALRRQHAGPDQHFRLELHLYQPGNHGIGNELVPVIPPSAKRPGRRWPGNGAFSPAASLAAGSRTLLALRSGRPTVAPYPPSRFHPRRRAKLGRRSRHASRTARRRLGRARDRRCRVQFRNESSISSGSWWPLTCQNQGERTRDSARPLDAIFFHPDCDRRLRTRTESADPAGCAPTGARALTAGGELTRP